MSDADRVLIAIAELYDAIAAEIVPAEITETLDQRRGATMDGTAADKLAGAETSRGGKGEIPE